MAMTTLQNPVKDRLDAITNDLKDVTKAQRSFGKALDKVRIPMSSVCLAYIWKADVHFFLSFSQALPHRELPMETDAMADHPALINRAIAMHLVREGQFSVASTFVRESRDHPGHSRDQPLLSLDHLSPRTARTDEDGDDDMIHEDGDEDRYDGHGANDYPEDLQGQFAEMYSLLSELRNKNLGPAIKWAHQNNSRLEATGSNLEFELCKLQFVWLFKGPGVNGLPDDENNGQMGALRYARDNFERFQTRHLKEIQQLCGAMVFAPNIERSPYRHIFQIDSAFEDVSTSFTREFCSLLGLSAESPLYVAVTAGSIALPRLIKYTTYMKEKKTEWTTENELAFETPLPPSMIYHSIFVCPVSKEQTTEQNPAMMIPCGHVICRESLHAMAKGSRYKCPYCPTEGHLKDAIKITL